MQQTCRRTIWGAALMGLLWAGALPAGEVHDHLEPLKHLCGQKYLGHYANSDESHGGHHIQWEMMLGGHAVRSVMEVPAQDLTVEILYYWDPEFKRIRFVSVSNQGQAGKGFVQAKFGVVTLVGSSHGESGKYQFKTTYELLRNGELNERFLLRQGQVYKQQHHIVYDPVEGSGGEQAPRVKGSGPTGPP